MSEKFHSNRRGFFKWVGLGIASYPLLKVTQLYAEMPAKCPQGDPTDPKVLKKKLDYTGKTAKRVKFYPNFADATKEKKYKANMNCYNCKFYKDYKKDNTWGKCAMVANKYVPACGWCSLHKPNKKKIKA